MKVGRVGENQIDATFRDGGKDFEAIALVNIDVVLRVVEDGLGQARAFCFLLEGCLFALGQDGSTSLVASKSGSDR
jgi:hypothetical protein